jgi:hypothetical protein
VMKFADMAGKAYMNRGPSGPRAGKARAWKLEDQQEEIVEFLREWEGRKLEELFARYLDLSRAGIH